MKKIIGVLIFLSIITVFNVGSVFAESKSPLQSEVDKLIGIPYLYGGTTTEGFDCSGFIQYVYNQVNVELPRTTKLQAKEGVKVEKKNLRAGDIVFFNTDGTGISHAGIYMGEGLFSHSSASKGVRISKLSEDYYVERYVTARRIISNDEYKKLAEDR
ncbi:C40 family peptidase [Paenibacillus vini]|uniref:C40 family peptidase n=1 Tax=Paenibacillus vini TaxID=1476024 RepID=UPI0025B69140|nr:C40 family peptidase [Paenibacillus vini]MDN4067588.1 C40 family peptidase [Paenibacillus vini]